MVGLLIFMITVFLGGLAALLWMSYSATRDSMSSDDYTFIDAQWLKIVSLLNSSDQAARERAIVDADKLLDYAMRRKRVLGRTFKERFQRIESQFTNSPAVWKAHQLRNKLVHEPGFDVSLDQMRTALLAYKQALIDLKVLKQRNGSPET